jgi:hypothetical protein
MVEFLGAIAKQTGSNRSLIFNEHFYRRHMCLLSSNHSAAGKPATAHIGCAGR